MTYAYFPVVKEKEKLSFDYSSDYVKNKPDFYFVYHATSVEIDCQKDHLIRISKTLKFDPNILFRNEDMGQLIFKFLQTFAHVVYGAM